MPTNRVQPPRFAEPGSLANQVRPVRQEPMMRTSNVTEIPGLAFPASAQERRAVFWRLSPVERIALMRAGELTLKECCQWAARVPHEVPIVNGEFEFIAAFTPEVREQ